MNSALRHAPDGFSRIIAASLILHLAVIVFGLVIYKGGANKIYMTPVTVSLVGPEALGRQGVSAAGRVAATAATTEAFAEKQAARPAAKPALKAAAVTTPRIKSSPAEKIKNPFALKKTKDNSSVEDAIKRVKEKVRKKEAKEELQAAESHIDALKKKNASSAPLYSSPLGGTGKLRGGSKPSNGLQAFSKADGAGQGKGKTGGGGTGAIDGPSVKYRAYLTAIGDRVKRNWTYPEELHNNKVEVIVSIKIDRNGKLIDSWVEKSSGSNPFDESLMDAVKKSAPYPQIPQDYDGDVFETGLRFCKNCAQ